LSRRPDRLCAISHGKGTERECASAVRPGYNFLAFLNLSFAAFRHDGDILPIHYDLRQGSIPINRGQIGDCGRTARQDTVGLPLRRRRSCDPRELGRDRDGIAGHGRLLVWRLVWWRA
jgi:hypothetical protein